MPFTPEQFEEMSGKLGKVKEEIGKFIVGQQEAVEFSLYSILADGHALLKDCPGLERRCSFGRFQKCSIYHFHRIQFTPDLMPADITGTSILERNEEGMQRFVFKKGPIFSQMVLADEINRATPKTQSALLEAMGEKTVTVLGETREMARPFFVLATQNPIEMEGTYPLPEAQMDRFLCKIILPYPSKSELKEIIMRTTGPQHIDIQKVMDAEEIVMAQEMVKEVVIADEMIDYAVDLVAATHNKKRLLRMNGQNMSSMEADHGDFSQLSDLRKHVRLWQGVIMFRLQILKQLLNLHCVIVFSSTMKVKQKALMLMV